MNQLKNCSSTYLEREKKKRIVSSRWKRTKVVGCVFVNRLRGLILLHMTTLPSTFLRVQLVLNSGSTGVQQTWKPTRNFNSVLHISRQSKPSKVKPEPGKRRWLNSTGCTQQTHSQAAQHQTVSRYVNNSSDNQSSLFAHRYCHHYHHLHPAATLCRCKVNFNCGAKCVA